MATKKPVKKSPKMGGMAGQAQKALSGRGKQLKKQMCKAMGQGYNQSTGRCKR